MTGTDVVSSGGGDDEHYSRLIRELSALLVTIVSPSTVAAPGRPQKTSPAAVASMLLGASVALMLCGSVTFAIGLLLMPWVAGLALLFGFAGAVSTLLPSGIFGNAPRALPSSSRDGDRRPGRLLTAAEKPRFGYAASLPAA